jgi:hypothetical protein
MRAGFTWRTEPPTAKAQVASVIDTSSTDQRYRWRSQLHMYTRRRPAISDILGVPNNCEVLLSGNVRRGDECQMRVQLSGETLDCNVDNGWRLKDARTIEVTGEPCERYRADPMLS